jgi:hypothetical protein
LKESTDLKLTSTWSSQSKGKNKTSCKNRWIEAQGFKKGVSGTALFHKWKLKIGAIFKPIKKSKC